jgi:energy-coupling factor transporter ATP-binding protein EcfA2
MSGGNISINSCCGRPIAKLGKKIVNIIGNQDEIRDNEISVTAKLVVPSSDASKFQQVPDETRERDILYVTGPSGSGKSTYVVNYLNEYKKKYKRRPIFVLSSLKEDETLDKVKDLKRIKLDEKMYNEPLEAEMFEECCVVADDVDVISDRKIREAVIILINQILEIGRHFKITLIMTSHLATSGRDTRRILNEAHSITYFPHSGSSHGIKYLLTEYCGIDKKDQQIAKRSGSRWCTVFKNYPCVMMVEKMVWQPDQED